MRNYGKESKSEGTLPEGQGKKEESQGEGLLSKEVESHLWPFSIVGIDDPFGGVVYPYYQNIHIYNVCISLMRMEISS